MDQFTQMLNQMTAVSYDQRTDVMMTLGRLISQLKALDPTLKVVFSHNKGVGPTEPHSYRGYYSDLALEPGTPPTVGEVVAMLEEANGETFEGYKGWDCKMQDNTPVWCSIHGSTGKPIVAVLEVMRTVLLVTGHG